MSEIDIEETPSWLIEVLESAQVTESLRERMKKAGSASYAMARMRTEKEKIGFVPLPFAEYLEGLATLAGVSLAPVLAAAGISSAAKPTVGTAERIGRLAHTLGLQLEDLILHLRVGIAEQTAGAPLPMLAAHRGVSTGGRPRECSRFLDQLELRWPPDLRNEMDAIREAAASGFRARAAEEFEIAR